MRPFVLVQKPYPIWASTIFVDARVSDDGRSAKLLGSVPADFVRAFVVSDTPNNLSTKSITISAKPSAPTTPTAQAGETSVAGTPTAGKAPPASSTGSAAPPVTKAGSGSIAYQVDKDGTPIVPVNDLFSIIFLPDFKREYAIDLSSRFGFAKIQIKVAPGGGLLAYNGDVDNSLLIGPLVDVYTNLVKAGGAVAAAAINPHAAATAALAGSPSAQSGETSVPGAAPKLTPASIVTLRLTLIRYATPGPHPILKPGEHRSIVDPKTGLATVEGSSMPGEYSVDYTYFEVPVAEALLDSPGLLTVVAETKSPKSGGAAGGCSAKKMLSSGAATALNLGKIIAVIGKDLKTTDSLTVKTATASNLDADNCVGEIDLTATATKPDGSSQPFTDGDGSVAKKFAEEYPGTNLVFK